MLPATAIKPVANNPSVPGSGAMKLPALPVAVNVSAVQFRQEGFPQLIRRVLDETGLGPQFLELELTCRPDFTWSMLACLSMSRN
jgi:EAL domain-containing protein (putative c-di-GMP-specific phosphodiesterase class I)